MSHRSSRSGRARIAAALLILIVAVAVAACRHDLEAEPLPAGGPGGPGGTVLTLTTFESATLVLGQANFTSGLDNRGGSTAGDTLSSPNAAPLALGPVLYVPDRSNHRVLGYLNPPAGNGAGADFVVGQSGQTGAVPATTAQGLSTPQGIAVGVGKLLIRDSSPRVVIHNTAPTATFTAANVAVGQADLTSSAQGCTAVNFGGAIGGISVGGGRLIVADSANHRVLIWNSIPATSGVAADLVLGQNSFTNCVGNDGDQDGSLGPTSAATLSQPGAVWSDGTRLAVADSTNNRILIWSTFPVTNFTPADLVLGQGNFTLNQFNDDDQNGGLDPNPSARTLHTPLAVTSDGTRLLVSDTDNHRVLVWESFPVSNFQPADTVLGQGAFDRATPNDDNQDGTNDGAPTARVFNRPGGLHIVGASLFVADQFNHRVLRFN